MKKILVGFIMLGAIFTSCKDDKNTDSAKDGAPAAAVSLPFTVTLRATVEKNDNFAIYYNEEGKDDYKPENVVIVEIKGSPNPQDVTFKMEEGVSPTNLRFDLGSNPELKSVKIEGLTLINGSKSFTAPGKDFIKYFTPNTQITFDEGTSTATMVADPKASYAPILLASPSLQAEMVKLYN